MAQQTELFPEPSRAVQIDKSRNEPRLWVRRLVIWENPDTIIRDFLLRRGMNIIWSPDPGISDSKLGQSAGGGHGAGKTLFCRLIRYCLGESQFANTALKQSITENLPTGLVGAEVMINGTPWAVIRPIGMTRKHWAVENQSLESVLEADDMATGITPLLDAISSSCFSEDLKQALPGTSEHKEWLYALGWMSRDQECRYDKTLDWRHKDANTGSPLRDVPGDKILLIVRLYLGLISKEEMTVRKHRDALPGENTLEQKISDNSRWIEQAGAELAQALGVAMLASPSDPFGAEILSGTAKENLTNIKRLGRPKASTDTLLPLQKRRDEIVGQIAIMSNQIIRTDSLIDAQSRQLAKIRGEKENLDGEDLKAQQGNYCPICNVEIDWALAEGCGLSHLLRDVEKIQGEKAQKEAVFKNCNDLIENFKRQKVENEIHLSGLSSERAKLDVEIAGIEKQDQAAMEIFRRTLYEAEDKVRQSNRLTGLLETKTNASKALTDRNQEYKNLTDQLDLLRKQHGDTMTRLNELFDYVSKGVLGVDTTGTLKLSGNGLQANVQVGGLAMMSLKAIVFDVTAMLMSLEGRSELPAFLMHDSPREADLGLSLYHRVFQLLHELDDMDGSAPFQYIITTTTEPPKDIRMGDSLIATLDGSDVENKLLRRNFLGGHDTS